MTKYFATGNVLHNGQAYARGEEVHNLSDEQILSLTADGVISTEAPEVVEPVAVSEAAASAGPEPEVLGTSESTGEPVVDGALDVSAEVSTEAVDVTPGLESEAPEASTDASETVAEATTDEAPVAESAEPTAEPTTDPSENL